MPGHRERQDQPVLLGENECVFGGLVLRASTRISPWLLRNTGAPNRSARSGVPVTKRKTFACLAASAAAAASTLSAFQGSANAAAHVPAPVSKHVLLISVDGMHQSDL